jgi:hypothetical protein
VKIAISVLLLAPAMAACAVPVHALNPKPNVDLDRSDRSLGLQLDPAVHDQFVVHAEDGYKPMTVEHWHETLMNGFANGYGEAFTLAKGPSQGLVLEIAEAEPEMTRAAVNADSSAAATAVQIHFKARLRSANAVVCRSHGTVSSKKAVGMAWEIPNAVSSAIETMYEAIARDCFTGERGAASQQAAPGAGEASE